jgi:hypothetical protein
MPPPVKPNNWGQRPGKKPAAPPDALDKFVSGGKDAKADTVRLNIDVPRQMRNRIKASCATAGRNMNEVLIEMLEERFPE